MRCNNCGNEVPYSSGYCPYCGARVGMDIERREIQMQRPGQKQTELEPVKPEKTEDTNSQSQLHEFSGQPQRIEKQKKKFGVLKLMGVALIAVILLTAAYFNIHIWQEATCTVPKSCIICSKTEGNLLSHTYADATCKAPEICTMCGDTQGNRVGHTWNDDKSQCLYCKKHTWEMKMEKLPELPSSYFQNSTGLDGKVKHPQKGNLKARYHKLLEPIYDCTSFRIRFEKTGATIKDGGKKWGVWVRELDGEWHYLIDFDCAGECVDGDVMIPIKDSLSFDSVLVACVDRKGSTDWYGTSTNRYEIELTGAYVLK